MKIIIYACDWCGSSEKEDKCQGGMPIGWTEVINNELICGLCARKANDAKINAFNKVKNERKKLHRHED